MHQLLYLLLHLLYNPQAAAPEPWLASIVDLPTSARPACLEPSCRELALDRPEQNRSSPDQPKCRALLLPLPEKQFAVCPLSLSLLVPYTFFSLSLFLLFGVLTHFGSLSPLVKPQRPLLQSRRGSTKRPKELQTSILICPLPSSATKIPREDTKRDREKKDEKTAREKRKSEVFHRKKKNKTSTKCWAPTPDRPTRTSAGFLLLLCCCFAAALLLLCCCFAAALLLLCWCGLA